MLSALVFEFVRFLSLSLICSFSPAAAAAYLLLRGCSMAQDDQWGR